VSLLDWTFYSFTEDTRAHFLHTKIILQLFVSKTAVCLSRGYYKVGVQACRQEMKWGVKKWKMGGVFCKKVDLSSTQVCIMYSISSRQEGRGETNPLLVDVQKLCNMCVLSHDKYIARPLSKEPH